MINQSHSRKKRNRLVKYSLFKNQIRKQQNKSVISPDQNIPQLSIYRHNYPFHKPEQSRQIYISRPNSKSKVQYLRQLFSLQNSNTHTPIILEQIQRKINPFEKIDLIKNSQKIIKTRNSYFKRQKITKKQKIFKKTNETVKLVNKSEQSLQKLIQLQKMIKKLGLSLQKNRNLIKDGLNSIHKIYLKQQFKSQHTEQKHINRRIHNYSTILGENLQQISKHKINKSQFQKSINKNFEKNHEPIIMYSKKHTRYQK